MRMRPLLHKEEDEAEVSYSKAEAKTKTKTVASGPCRLRRLYNTGGVLRTT